MKKIVYLVGSIEFAKNFGKDWRNFIAPKLRHHDFIVLDPCKLEKRQLRDLFKKPIPKEVIGDDGKYYKVNHWHDLYHARAGSKWRKFFDACMDRVMLYDINIVKERCDSIICMWDDACEGSVGSHGELTLAYDRKIPVVIIHATSRPLPRWAYRCAKYGRIVRTLAGAINATTRLLK